MDRLQSLVGLVEIGVAMVKRIATKLRRRRWIIWARRGDSVGGGDVSVAQRFAVPWSPRRSRPH
jgi:hypothetical protein